MSKLINLTATSSFKSQYITCFMTQFLYTSYSTACLFFFSSLTSTCQHHVTVIYKFHLVGITVHNLLQWRFIAARAEFINKHTSNAVTRLKSCWGWITACSVVTEGRRFFLKCWLNWQHFTVRLQFNSIQTTTERKREIGDDMSSCQMQRFFKPFFPMKKARLSLFREKKLNLYYMEINLNIFV